MSQCLFQIDHESHCEIAILKAIKAQSVINFCNIQSDLAFFGQFYYVKWETKKEEEELITDHAGNACSGDNKKIVIRNDIRLNGIKGVFYSRYISVILSDDEWKLISWVHRIYLQ